MTQAISNRRSRVDADYLALIKQFPIRAIRSDREHAMAGAGFRAVAPFMRGYVPSSLPSDGSYHVGALMDDAIRVLQAAGPTGRDVVIGHDWGAIATAARSSASATTSATSTSPAN